MASRVLTLERRQRRAIDGRWRAIRVMTTIRRRAVLPCLVLAAITLGAAPSIAAQRAMLVGINDYSETAPGGDAAGAAYDLRGCHNDVRRFEALLKERFGFADGDILKLFDGQATCAGVIDAFRRHLVDGVGPGDTVVFYFSGHGTYVADLDGDESDFRDEVLATHDINGLKPESWLTDDVIRLLLRQVRARHALVIYDCCHSGTGTRAAAEQEGAQPLPEGFRWKFLPMDFSAAPATSGAQTVLGTMGAGDDDPNHIFLAACSPAQKALEASDPGTGEPCGAFTSTLCEMVRQLGPGTTFEALRERIRPEVDNYAASASGGWHRQTPLFEGRHLGAPLDAYLAGRTPVVPVEAPAAGVRLEGVPVMGGTSAAAGEIVPGWRPQGSITLLLRTDKARYGQGEPIRLFATADQTCHLRVYRYGADNRVALIYPPHGQAPRPIPAGEEVELRDGDRGLGHGPAPGNEILKAFACSRPFTPEECQQFEDLIFRQFAPIDVQELRVRGLAPDTESAREDRGEAMLIYNVGL